MTDRPAVTDWVTDFDPIAPEFVADPHPILADIRARCPVAHTDRMSGVYLSTTYDAARRIALDTGSFSSRRIVVRETRPEQLIPAPPFTLDPPHHAPLKRMLLPPFRREAVARLEPRIRATCRDLLAGLGGRTECDAVRDYATRVASRTMTHLLGVPESDDHLLLKWIHEFFVVGPTDPARFMRAIAEVEAYFAGFVEERRREGRDDMITMLVEARGEDGEPMADRMIHAMLRGAMMAGIDTTQCVIASAIWHMAGHPEDRDHLVAHPDAVAAAAEEFLRLYAPVTPAREVVRETVVDGCPMKPDNMVLVSFPAANRDPAVFADPDRFVADRRDNRHLAFGFGIHKCTGMHLGRAEVVIAIEEWLKAIPRFSLAGEVTWTAAQVRGPDTLPIAIG